jgi:pilus assembly protein CpaF
MALSDPATMVVRVTQAICDFGPLSSLFGRSDVEEIFIEGDRVLYLDQGGRLRGLAAPTTEAENRQVIDQLLSQTQRHLDAKSPLVQARVLQGAARLSAAIPPVADRLSATLRKYTLRKESLPYLLERGSLSPPAASFLWAVGRHPSSPPSSPPPLPTTASGVPRRSGSCRRPSPTARTTRRARRRSTAAARSRSGTS